MSEPLERCSFEFDPNAWEREHDKKCFVDPDRDEEILIKNADGDTVWRCPHGAADDEAECLFHLPRDSPSKPDAGTVADAFLDITNGDREALNGDGLQPAQFLGATFESLDLDTEQVGDGGPIDLRHTNLGSAEWEIESIEAEQLDVRGVIVRSGWDCRGVTFRDDVRFTGAEFGGYAAFSRAKFGADALFAQTEFCAGASFIETDFGGDVWFDDAEFSGNVWFKETEFSSNAWFDDAEFSGDVWFDDAEFGGNAGFRWTEFGSDAQFSWVKFGGGAFFEWAEFGNVVRFNETKFDGGARFIQVDFGSDAVFNGAKFSADALFVQTEFCADSWFIGTEFDGDAKFHQAEFGGDVVFYRAEFRQETTFTVAGWYPISQFQGNAAFNNVTAEGPLRFVDKYDSPPRRPYTFLGEVDFEGANIPKAEFSGVSFREPPMFADANLTRADLSNIPFEGASFEGADLTRANLSDSDVSGAGFYNTLLSQASLYGTNLRNAGLYGTRMDGAHISDHTDFGVRNHEGMKRSSAIPFRGPWPGIHYDERNPEYEQFADADSDESSGSGGKVNDYTRAAAVYGEIERVARMNADSELSSRCYLWRKDMQRKRYQSSEGRRSSRQSINWMRSWIANVFVRYGESPWRVTTVAGLIIVSCAVLYYTFDLIEYRTSPTQELLSVAGSTPPAPVVTFLDAIYFSTLTFSTLGMGTFEPTGPLGRVVTIFETLSGVVLLALLVFVFGRRATR